MTQQTELERLQAAADAAWAEARDATRAAEAAWDAADEARAAARAA